ncbi:MAG: transporter family carbohydrate exporter [Pseudomonadota bacterium]|jgi:ABC-type multidrug transport system ATPase subunit
MRDACQTAWVRVPGSARPGLDSITEQAIQDALDTVMRGKTVLVVAHRLSTIANLDRILVFEGGHIVEDGTHSELLQKRGAYHALWSRQSHGFLTEAEDVPGDDTQKLSRPSVVPPPEVPHVEVVERDDEGLLPSFPKLLGER